MSLSAAGRNADLQCYLSFRALVCCLQGSLRDALDCGLLSKPGSYLAPSVVLTLAHDICAAMLHLHRSVVHNYQGAYMLGHAAIAVQLCHN
jgi:hypothetical protein